MLVAGGELLRSEVISPSSALKSWDYPGEPSRLAFETLTYRQGQGAGKGGGRERVRLSIKKEQNAHHSQMLSRIQEHTDKDWEGLDISYVTEGGTLDCLLTVTQY